MYICSDSQYEPTYFSGESASVNSSLLTLDERQLLLKAGIAAPSGDNMQPWSFCWKGDALEISLDTPRCSAIFDYSGLAPRLSVGALVENIRLMALRLGLASKIVISDDGVRVARIGFERTEKREQCPSFASQLFLRSVNRAPFKANVISEHELAALRNCVDSDTMRLEILSGLPLRREALKQLRRVDTLRFCNKRMHEELYSKLVFGEAAETCREGLAVQTLGLNGVQARVMKALKSWPVMRGLQRACGVHHLMAAEAMKLNLSAPSLGAILVKKVSSSSAIEAGRAMERVWLQASELGLALQPISVLPYLIPLAESELLSAKERETVKAAESALRSIWGLSVEENFVFLFRLGYPSLEVARSKRRPVGDYFEKNSSRAPLSRPAWNYEEAFSRHAGIISAAEQAKLQNSCIAIPGLGGVGGIHLMTLARLGIENFRIADFDRFELANFNRQYGASMSTLGLEKLAVMAEKVKDINPNISVRSFPAGLNENNIGDFLDGADLVVDSLDFFAIETRRLLFKEARKRGIWAITAGPSAASASWLMFSPEGMDFDTYFDIRDEMSEEEKFVQFAIGLVPKAIHLDYVELSKYFSISNRSGSSLGLACNLASGIVAAQAMKILLGRPGVKAVPHYGQFDAYLERSVHGVLRGGNRHPWQRVRARWLNKQIQKRK